MNEYQNNNIEKRDEQNIEHNIFFLILLKKLLYYEQIFYSH